MPYLSEKRGDRDSMFNLENEMILLKEWASGRHKEDMQTFEPKTFYNSKLFEDIRDGASIGQISVNISAGAYEGVRSLTELLGLEGGGAFYYGALGDAYNEQRKRYIQGLEANPTDQAYWIEQITNITNLMNSQEETAKSANFADLFFNELEARQNESNPHYGIKPLDEITEGLHRGQLVVMAARPGCGKSLFGLQVARSVIEEGFKCLYLPLEMTEYETLQRLIVQAQVVFDSSEAKNPTPQQREDIRQYLEELESSSLFSMYCGLNQLASIEKKTKEEEPFLLVVDQLTQVEPSGKSKDIRDQYMKVTAALKRLALSENVCILALHQLNRAGAERKRPSLENLAESDSVGRDADVVLTLNTNEDEDYKSLRYEELFVVKNRQGRAGDKIPLMLNGERSTFNLTAPRSLADQEDRF